MIWGGSLLANASFYWRLEDFAIFSGMREIPSTTFVKPCLHLLGRAVPGTTADFPA